MKKTKTKAKLGRRQWQWQIHLENTFQELSLETYDLGYLMRVLRRHGLTNQNAIITIKRDNGQHSQFL